MDEVIAVLGSLRARVEAEPREAVLAAGFVLLLVILLARALGRSWRRRGQARAFLCDRNRRAVGEAVLGYCRRARRRMEPLDVGALVRERWLEERLSCCRRGGRYSLSYEGGSSGAAPPVVVVTCSKHGSTRVGAE